MKNMISRDSETPPSVDDWHDLAREYLYTCLLLRQSCRIKIDLVIFFYFRVSTHWQTEIGNLFPSGVSHAFSHPFITRAYIFKKPTPRETGKNPLRDYNQITSFIRRRYKLSDESINHFSFLDLSCRNWFDEFYIWICYIWRVAFLRLPREPNYRFGKNRFCRQSAPRESSGRTDYTNLRHFSVRVFSVRGHGREVPRMRYLSFDVLSRMPTYNFDICTFGGMHL